MKMTLEEHKEELRKVEAQIATSELALEAAEKAYEEYLVAEETYKQAIRDARIAVTSKKREAAEYRTAIERAYIRGRKAFNRETFSVPRGPLDRLARRRREELRAHGDLP